MHHFNLFTLPDYTICVFLDTSYIILFYGINFFIILNTVKVLQKCLNVLNFYSEPTLPMNNGLLGQSVMALEEYVSKKVKVHKFIHCKGDAASL